MDVDGDGDESPAPSSRYRSRMFVRVNDATHGGAMRDIARSLGNRRLFAL